MNLGLQPKFLRTLDDKPYRQLGGQIDMRVSARIIAATNADLEAEMRVGRFRKDLFYRLNEIAYMVPPLRDRKEDIPILVAHFWKADASPGAELGQFPDDVLTQMMEHDWPGNIRELRSAVKRQRFRHGAPDAPPQHLSYVVNGSPPIAGGQMSASIESLDQMAAFMRGLPGGIDSNIDALQKRIIVLALRESDGNKRQTAKFLGMSRSTFVSRCQRLGVKETDFN